MLKVYSILVWSEELYPPSPADNIALVYFRALLYFLFFGTQHMLNLSQLRAMKTEPAT